VKLLEALAWVLLVAWGAAKLWGWAWDSVSGSEEGWRSVPIAPPSLTRDELEEWVDRFEREW
jgi:hypothetical protein